MLFFALVFVTQGNDTTLRAESLDKPAPPADILDEYRTQVAQWQYDLDDAPFETLIMKNWRTIYEAYDQGSKEYSAVIDKNSLWPLASISKVFGLTLFLQFVDEGRMNLDTRVAEYFDAFKVGSSLGHDRTAVTIRDHATKTVALGTAETQSTPSEGNLKYDLCYLKKPLNDIERLEPLQWEILQDVIEKVEGANYTTLLRKNVLTPMQLQSVHPIYVYGLENSASDKEKWEDGLCN